MDIKDRKILHSSTTSKIWPSTGERNLPNYLAAEGPKLQGPTLLDHAIAGVTPTLITPERSEWAANRGGSTLSPQPVTSQPENYPTTQSPQEATAATAAQTPPEDDDDWLDIGDTTKRAWREFRKGQQIRRSVAPGVVPEPLTLKEKVHVDLLNTFQPETMLRIAATAGFATARDNPPEWPQTFEGYSWRFADRFGQRLVFKQVEFTLGSLILKEDPRYFESEDRSNWGRVKNAFKQTWITRRDNGKWAPAYGTFAGAYASAVVSSRWQPESRRDWEDMARRGSLQIIFQFGNNLTREFMPDLKKLFKR